MHPARRPLDPMAVMLAAALLLHALPAAAQTLRDDLWVTNGPVNAMLVSGSTLYIGGQFSQVGPATGGWVAVDTAASARAIPSPLPQVAGAVYCATADGSGGWFIGGSFLAVERQPRANLAHLDARGNLTAWNPGSNGPVYAMAVNSAGALVLGGGFTTVAGQARSHLAAVDTTGGALSAWNPSADGDVHAIAISGPTVFVGGTFAQVGGLSRPHLAELDASTGAVSSWAPSPNGEVFAIGVHYYLPTNTTTVYVGGLFTSIGLTPVARNNLALIDATVGSATFSQALSFNPNADGAVRALRVLGTISITIFAGGDFANIGGLPRNRIASLSGSGTATSWNPGVGGGRMISSVYALAFGAGVIYAGGTFDAAGGQARNGIVALDAVSGAATAWNPNANGSVNTIVVGGDGTVRFGGGFTSVGGVARTNLAALDLNSGIATSWNPGANTTVNAMAMVGGLIYVGGTFTSVGGVARDHVAQLGTDGSVGSWDAHANDAVLAIAGRAVSVLQNVIYLGGDFTSMGGQARRHLAAMTDGVFPSLTSWNPSADTTVNALVVSGSTIYAGGAFLSLGGHARLAALDLSGAALAWDANVDATVNALALSGTTLYLGGAFAQVGGTLHRGVAAVNAGTAAVLSWPAQVFGPVSAVRPTAGAVYVAGAFTNVGGQTRTRLAALDPVTGSPTAWDPEPWDPVMFPANLVLSNGYSLAEQSGRILAGSAYHTIHGLPHSNLAALFESLSAAVDPARPAPGVAALRGEPNPFRSAVALRFTVPVAGEGSVAVFDLQGRRVRWLQRGPIPAGEQRCSWDGRDARGQPVPAGVYLVRAQAGAWTARGRLLRVE